MNSDPKTDGRLEEAATYEPTALESPRFDVFVSFCSADRRQPWFGRTIDIVTELKSALERYRHPDTGRRLRVCTYDEDFELGEEVRGVIARMIGQSAAVLFLSSKHAAASAFVRFELETARAVFGEAGLIAALVDHPPHAAFPDLFVPDAHGADLSAADCGNRRVWDRRIDLEAAKIAARVWRLPLERVRDRFLLERQRTRRRRLGSIAIALVLLLTTAGVGYNQHRQREAARVLGVHQRYAASMAIVQRAWSAGNVDLVRATLASWQERVETPDPRSFEWHTYSLVATAERMVHGQFADPATALAAAPVEPWFAFATEKSPVEVWDAESGVQVAGLSPATAGSRSIAFSSDGARLFALADSGIVRWDYATRTESIIPAPAGEELVALAVVPTGVVAVDRRGKFYRLDGFKLALVRDELFQVEGRFRLACSASGRFLIGAGGDGRVQVADAVTAALLYTKEMPEFRSHDELAIRGESAVIPTAERLTLLDLATGRTQLTQRLGNGITLSGIAGSLDGRVIATGDPSDASIVLWQVEDEGNPRTWREIGSLKGYRGWINAIRFLPRSKRLVSSTLGGDVRVWDSGRIGRRVVRRHPRDISALGFVGGTRDVLSLDRGGFLRRWDAQTLTERWSRQVGERAAAIAPRGHHLAVAGEGLIRLLRADDGEEEGSMPGWEPLASAAGGSLFAFQGEGAGEVVIEVVAAGSRRSFHVEPEKGANEPDITSMAFAKRDEALLVATADGRILRFDLRGNRRAWTITAHGRVINAVAVAPDGELFATASSDKTVRFWRTKDGVAVGVLDGHADKVQSLAFSPDGKTLVSGSQDGLAKLWNVHAQIETVTFNAHARDLNPGVTALAFSPDGTHLLTGGAMGTIIVWDADTRKVIDELSQAGK
jgi:WD40 repeat protein